MLQVDREYVADALKIIEKISTRWQVVLNDQQLPGVDVPATGLTSMAWKRSFVHELLVVSDLAQSLAARTVELQE